MSVSELLMLQMIVVFLIDLSGGVTTIKHILSYILTKGKIVSDDFTIPLISCSLCVFFHLGWISLLLTSSFTMSNFLIVCILAYLTPVTKDILFIIKELLLKLINYPYDKGTI